jgi:hypothetical protein
VILKQQKIACLVRNGADEEKPEYWKGRKMKGRKVGDGNARKRSSKLRQ